MIQKNYSAGGDKNIAKMQNILSTIGQQFFKSGAKVQQKNEATKKVTSRSMTKDIVFVKS